MIIFKSLLRIVYQLNNLAFDMLVSRSPSLLSLLLLLQRTPWLGVTAYVFHVFNKLKFDTFLIEIWTFKKACFNAEIPLSCL